MSKDFFHILDSTFKAKCLPNSSIPFRIQPEKPLHKLTILL